MTSYCYNTKAHLLQCGTIVELQNVVVIFAMLSRKQWSRQNISLHLHFITCPIHLPGQQIRFTARPLSNSIITLSLCLSAAPLDVPTVTTAGPLYQETPASPAIATATWTYPYRAAVIQSQASVCAVGRVTVGRCATVALTVTTGMLSRQKTANVSRRTNDK